MEDKNKIYDNAEDLIADLHKDRDSYKEEMFDRCRQLLKKSNCKLVHFGSVIVDEDGYIIGEGYNHSLDTSKCCLKDRLSKKVIGRNPGVCTAIHSEWMAIIEAISLMYLENRDLSGCTLYIVGEYPDGTPYKNKSGRFACTVCARLLKYTGVERIVSPNRDSSIDEAFESAYEDILEKLE